MRKLQFCCGCHILKGWDNFNNECDITKELPFPNNYANYIFIEHGIEHITAFEAWNFIKEIHRILKPGGKIRIAFPDIVKVAWKNNRELNEGICSIAKAHGMNVHDPVTVRNAVYAICFHFGHKAIWDVPLLCTVLEVQGFKTENGFAPGISEDNNLKGLESRGMNENKNDSSIIEAEKK